MRISDWSSDVCSSDLLDEAFAAAQLLCRGEDAGEPSSALLAAVPPQAGGPPWGGFVTLFPDPEFPHFGAVLASEAVADDPSCAEIVISGAEAFELEDRKSTRLNSSH